jgi:sugar phosphate isomerase/epimerase
LFENHSKPGVWELPDFAFSTEVFLQIAEAIKDTGIGINFDTANPLAFGDDPLPILESVIDQVVTVHASDTSIKGRLEPVLLGDGLVPFDPLFSRLKQHGFDGWICIEEASRRGEEGIRLATEFIRQTWAGL